MANMFNEDGTYNKTEWKAGDKITAVKLNKIESSLEAINNNDIDRHIEADSRLDILEERDVATNERINELEDVVTTNKDAVEAEMVNITTRLNKIESNASISVKDFGAGGDGVTDDTKAIQDAIESLTDGDTLVFPKGRYIVTSSLTIDKKVTVNGGGTLVLGGVDFDLLRIRADGSVVENLNFENPDYFTPSSTSVFTKGCAIHVAGNDCIIQNNKIDNFVLGIMFGTNGGPQFGCTIDNNLITNLLPISTGFPNDGILCMTGGAIITNNRVFGKSNQEKISRAGICCDLNAQYSIISDNFIDAKDNIKACIHVESSEYCIISNNQCRNPKWQGMTTSSYCVIENNYIETPSAVDPSYTLTQSAIFANTTGNLTINGNIIFGKCDSILGMSFSGGGFNIISHNRFIGSMSNGMRLHTASNSSISSNTFPNSCKGVAILSAGANNSFYENYICGGERGIIVAETSKNATIFGNKISNTSISGIRLYNTTDVAVLFNTITDDASIQQYGIEVDNVGDHKKVYLYNNLIGDMTIDKIKYGTYSGNVFLSNETQLTMVNADGAKKKITIDSNNELFIK